ncbi:MAG: hypothetical protein H0X64_02250 [Gemmatimonadaceae bacterium]|nr:hypothetical protein [Gemmatimonadaceae bacterium]
MHETLATMGQWLLQATTAFPDTLFTRQVAAEPSSFDRIAGIASGLMSIALTALAIAVIPAAWNLRNSHKKLTEVLDRVYGDINPIMRHASSIADNVDYITTSVRTDVQQINATIAAANQRLHQAVDQTEERLQEFNALIAVVQQEAEQLFVSTAATARGVRAGAATLGADVGAEITRARDAELLDLEELATLDAMGYSAHDADDYEEGGLGINDTDTEAGRSGPRVRPRHGRGFPRE